MPVDSLDAYGSRRNYERSAKSIRDDLNGQRTAGAKAFKKSKAKNKVAKNSRRLNRNNLALFYGTLTSQSETYTNYATSSDNMAAMPSDAF